MADVTDADREKAEEVWSAWIASTDAMDVFIAEALAEERAKARAPFLALAARYDGLFGCGELVAGIRRAAEVNE